MKKNRRSEFIDDPENLKRILTEITPNDPPLRPGGDVPVSELDVFKLLEKDDCGFCGRWRFPVNL